MHYPAVVECLHTSSSLHTVMSELETQGHSLIERYKQYVDHSCLQRYQDDTYTVQERQFMGEKNMARTCYGQAIVKLACISWQAT